MAIKTILSKNQQKLLDIISKDEAVCANFYLTGGTALAEFYLKHRLSEDLDFFSEKEFDPQDISIFLKKIQKEVGIREVELEQSFNRNLFFLKLKNDAIKTEFTYFPFPCIEKVKKIGKLFVDSLIDIAVNKVFTIYQKPRARDFIDLYLILQQQGWKTSDLVKKAKIKFDWHVDSLQLGSQFMRATEVKDFPKMISKISNKDWQSFFVDEAKKMKNNILK
ncbi:nucleotidyl transferase AbiEii/AbiGii toxin family protein [Patescibacteria group bacterium]|nr:nucleotidyl transferase AbiEii/AbiGii toxin family protein [Patescibacteria group bacterium]MBU1612817.1 nucleotidyl transferase AbiEii/AbiGii toxin family protein [Patescibacteria group bacterium]